MQRLGYGINRWLRTGGTSLLVGATAILLAASARPSAAQDSRSAGTTGSSDTIVEFIDEQVQQSWKDNRIDPSERAGDAEWLRRVYLDLVGHIPPSGVVRDFLENSDADKRAQVIDRLLDSPGYVRNWTTIWTNLCIGRSTPEEVSRLGMKKFFREAFTRNRPWNEVVRDLIAAEGHYERTGAVNYLLAQMDMNDDGVQATAKTTRLFLGIQVQCTQCHNHPFNDWQQDQFWQFNSFFREARRVEHEKYDPQSGRMEHDYTELVDRDFSGPVYFEKRSGLMQVAYPQFFETKVDPGSAVNRREKLADLVTESDWLAKAMVNRMWGHFFGYGFTKPVDDMGPHNPPSHPALLEKLTEEFVKSRYDVKQLIRWITNSRPYNLTSRFGKTNEVDDPGAGETPLFSHMYLKQMNAEQLYDSLIVATNAHKAGRSSWEEAEQQRQEWLQQFVVTFGNGMMDETTTFNGTIPQALMMMNGDLTKNAISVKQGSYLRKVLENAKTDAKRIRNLYVTALSRYPTRREQQTALRMVRRSQDKLTTYQDLFWALLNSNEFILVH